MSLYRHVVDRQALVIAMLDVVADGIVLPALTDDPRAEITALMSVAHESLRRDAWAVQVLVTEGLAGPLILPLVERIFVALGRPGIPAREALSAYWLIWQYMFGELLVIHHGRPNAFARQMVRSADPTQFPAIAAVVAAAPPDAPREYFAENPQRLLDGLLAPIPPGRAPRSHRPSTPRTLAHTFCARTHDAACVRRPKGVCGRGRRGGLTRRSMSGGDGRARRGRGNGRRLWERRPAPRSGWSVADGGLGSPTDTLNPLTGVATFVVIAALSYRLFGGRIDAGTVLVFLVLVLRSTPR